MEMKVGTYGKVQVGATILNVEGWSFEPTAATVETTHSGGSGFESHEFTTRGGRGSFTCTWDQDAKPTDNPPNLAPGAAKIALKLFIGDTAEYWYLPIVLVQGLPVTSEVKGGLKFTCNFITSGPYYEPGVAP